MVMITLECFSYLFFEKWTQSSLKLRFIKENLETFHQFIRFWNEIFFQISFHLGSKRIQEDKNSWNENTNNINEFDELCPISDDLFELSSKFLNENFFYGRGLYLIWYLLMSSWAVTNIRSSCDIKFRNAC